MDSLIDALGTGALTGILTYLALMLLGLARGASMRLRERRRAR